MAKIELNHAGIASLLQSDEVAEACKAQAERVAAAAGEGFEVTEKRIIGGSRYPENKGRASYGVKAATRQAREAEATEKALTRAVSSCRS